MPRLPRCDRPGRLQHLYNRGLSGRPVFETRKDIRYFLACVARAVRRGEIEVLAFCILTTHFHLLVRSPKGQVAVAMDRILNAYVRYYNRSRGRDGSLFRGRYCAKPVDALAYRLILVRYIDNNPVQARLASVPWDFPWCSAWHYIRERRPPWLDTTWVDSIVGEHGYKRPHEGYAEILGRSLTRCEARLVKGRMAAATNREEVLDDLIAAAPPRVLEWMQRKTRLADGAGLALPCADVQSVLHVLEAAHKREPVWSHGTETGQSRDAWPIAQAYLLRHLSGLPVSEIAKRLDISTSMAARRARQGQVLLEEDAAFADRLAQLARASLDRAHAPLRSVVGRLPPK